MTSMSCRLFTYLSHDTMPFREQSGLKRNNEASPGKDKCIVEKKVVSGFSAIENETRERPHRSLKTMFHQSEVFQRDVC